LPAFVPERLLLPAPVAAGLLAGASAAGFASTSCSSESFNGTTTSSADGGGSETASGAGVSGGDHDTFGLQRLDLGNRQFIVADHLDIGTQFTQVLHHVVGKGVVVIDH
jgi:hypothetical protein